MVLKKMFTISQTPDSFSQLPQMPIQHLSNQKIKKVDHHSKLRISTKVRDCQLEWSQRIEIIFEHEIRQHHLFHFLKKSNQILGLMQAMCLEILKSPLRDQDPLNQPISISNLCEQFFSEENRNDFNNHHHLMPLPNPLEFQHISSSQIGKQMDALGELAKTIQLFLNFSKEMSLELQNAINHCPIIDEQTQQKISLSELKTYVRKLKPQMPQPKLADQGSSENQSIDSLLNQLQQLTVNPPDISLNSKKISGIPKTKDKLPFFPICLRIQISSLIDKIEKISTFLNDHTK